MAATKKKLPYLEDLDPRELVLDNNPRTIVDLATDAPEMLASVGTHGVRFPIIATPTAQGPQVIDGFTRALCALHHEHTSVPVMHVSETDAAEWTRLVDQWIANEHRRGLGEADKATMIEQMALFGFSPEAISEQLTTDRDVVKAALAVRSRERTSSLARDHDQLDMLQLAAISEFENDEDAYAEIVDTLQNQPKQLDHVLARWRKEFQTRQARQDEIERLVAAGITVVEEAELPDTARALSTLTSSDGVVLADDPEQHRACPGHAATVRSNYLGEPRVTWYCQDWKKNGHEQRSQNASQDNGGQGLTDEQKAERQRAREHNPLWRTALEVRREWLHTFLQRKSPPKQARHFVAAALATGDERLTKAISRGSRYARSLLGDKPVDRLQAGGRRLTEDQVTMLQLALVLCAYEEAYDLPHTVTTWRSPSATDQRYFTALQNWGYTLSPVEELVVNPDAGTALGEDAEAA